MKFNIIENLWIKVMAVLMGLLLWIHVATDKEYTHQLNLPITEISLGDSLSLNSDTPDSLQVVVTATGKQLLRKKWRARGLRINASNFKPGKHNISLTTSNTSIVGVGTAVSLNEIVFPNSLFLNIDYKEEKYLPVNIDLSIETDDGYTVDRIEEPIPSEILVSGSRSFIKNITSVSTISRQLKGLRNNITLTLPILIPEMPDIEINPDSVTVSIIVVPVKTRVFKNLPVIVFNAPIDKTYSLDPATITIELIGPPSEIDLLNKNTLAASVDFVNRTLSSNKLPLKIDFPTKFKLKYVSTDSVEIIESN